MNPKIEEFIPLHPKDFYILFSLIDRERYGYSIIKDVQERTERRIRLEPGNLYRSIKKLMREDLLEESDRRPPPDTDDERRRYYRLTELGRQVVVEEAARMKALVTAAEALRVI